MQSALVWAALMVALAAVAVSVLLGRLKATARPIPDTAGGRTAGHCVAGPP